MGVGGGWLKLHFKFCFCCTPGSGAMGVITCPRHWFLTSVSNWSQWLVSLITHVCETPLVLRLATAQPFCSPILLLVSLPFLKTHFLLCFPSLINIGLQASFPMLYWHTKLPQHLDTGDARKGRIRESKENDRETRRNGQRERDREHSQAALVSLLACPR